MRNLSTLRRGVILLAIAFTACGTALPSVKPYKLDIQQGNVVTSKMLLQLRPGMTQSQVRFIMGTPLIQDSFHGKRWDYVYQMREKGKITEQRRVILDFENNLLKTVRGDVIPNGTGVAETNDSANTGVRVITPTAAPEDKGVISKLKFWEKTPAEKAEEAAAKAKADAEEVAKKEAELKESAAKEALSKEAQATKEVAAKETVPEQVSAPVEEAASVLAVPVEIAPVVEAPAVVVPATVPEVKEAVAQEVVKAPEPVVEVVKEKVVVPEPVVTAKPAPAPVVVSEPVPPLPEVSEVTVEPIPVLVVDVPAPAPEVVKPEVKLPVVEKAAALPTEKAAAASSATTATPPSTKAPSKSNKKMPAGMGKGFFDWLKEETGL